jgi:heme/copper-type cytochrome/quinol oxidase subunit 2
MIYDIQITAAQWALLSSWLQAIQDYVSNGFVFVVWATLALLFIMAIAFYFLFRGRRK